MIYFSPYTLTPLKELNSKSSLAPKKGLYLKTVGEDGEEGFADYFPHEALGDLPLKSILAGERDEYFEKCLWFARNERELSQSAFLPFKNHLLADSSSKNLEGAVKAKVKTLADLDWIKKLLQQNLRLRLDANGAISFEQWQDFLKSLSQGELDKIDYIEDPGIGDWRVLGVPSAKDFMENDHFDFLVYKPNARFCERPEKAIFSSYMGSDLGRFHCYLELIHRGNLELVHGIHTPGLYEEQDELFIPKKEGIFPDRSAVKRMYEELQSREWTCLS